MTLQSLQRIAHKTLKKVKNVYRHCHQNFTDKQNKAKYTEYVEAETRNADRFFTFCCFWCPQVKNRTTAHGMVAGGSSPVLTSWQDTFENTRARSHMSVCSATEPSAGPTTWHYTWRDMCERRHKQNREIQVHTHRG